MGVDAGRRLVRILVGLASTGIGILALAGSGLPHYHVFGIVLVGSGTVLAWLGLAKRPVGRVAWSATLACGAIGLLLSLLVVREDHCCMFGYHRGRGYPWGWLDSGAVADTRGALEAKKAAGQLHTTVDRLKVVMDGLFWWHAAVLLVVPASQVRRAVHGRFTARRSSTSA